jgi:methionyl-tRNA synthetase
MQEENKVLEKKYINIEDFAKIELKVGRIVEWHLVEGADKLYRFLVDVGETEEVKGEDGEVLETKKVFRTILSGVREYFPEGEVFVGKYVCVVSNLAPRKLRGFESNGMLLFAGGGSEPTPGNLYMVSPLPSITGEPKPGTIIR